jgi:hypothetical protein
MQFAVVLLALAQSASPACGPGYTCCCLHDTFIPVDCECVEDEATGTDNCARDSRRTHASIADAVIMKGQVCPKDAHRVSRADLLAREAAEKAWARNATQCATRCAKIEKAFYDGRNCENNDPYGTCEWDGDVERGCQCVCPFPNGRNGAGACVPCAHGYVNKTDEPGARAFKNGEFHCAFAQEMIV